MESLRKNLSAYTLDDAPEDVRELYKDEFIQLYASSIKCFFNMHQIGIYIGIRIFYFLTKRKIRQYRLDDEVYELSARL